MSPPPPFTPPGPAQIDALLQFLPVFEREGFVACWERSLPPGMELSPLDLDLAWEYAPELTAFAQAVYDEGFLYNFPWPEWQEQAEWYVNEPHRLEQADLLDICRLLTTHVRKERFCSGHLPEMVECGHISQVLRRLQTIRQAEGSGAPPQ